MTITLSGELVRSMLSEITLKKVKQVEEENARLKNEVKQLKAKVADLQNQIEGRDAFDKMAGESDV